LKYENAPTLAPGEKGLIAISSEVATVQEKSVTKYLVAFRGVRNGFPDAWWGVKGQDGKVEDKNEFTGLTLTSFSTGNDRNQADNLMMTLRPGNWSRRFHRRTRPRGMQAFPIAPHLDGPRVLRGPCRFPSPEFARFLGDGFPNRGVARYNVYSEDPEHTPE